MNESELIASILAGNVHAFGVLIRRHNAMLLRTARAILRDHADAEEAVQEACLQAYRSLASFRGESKLSTWLVRITANEAMMRRRRRVRAAGAMPMDDSADADERDGVSLAPGPESEAVRADLHRLLDEHIESLPEEYRAVFRLRALQELSVAEVAAALGIPGATVRTRYFRACRLLRDVMARELDHRSTLPAIFITDRDAVQLRALKPHAALLREIERAEIVSPKAAMLAEAVTMNTQVVYTDASTGTQRLVNIVFPHQARGCACSVSVLDPVGSALIGLPAGQSIEWGFPDGSEHRLHVDRVIHRDCPLRTGQPA
jgi:RNA polymerase sigma-70 factor (ECF subfamily)